MQCFCSFFTLLIEVILNAAKTVDEVGQQFSSFTTHVVSDIIIPNCVWRAGRCVFVHAGIFGYIFLP